MDQIGYRSYHFICDLGEKRVALPEFEVFRGRCFEIQVQTVLQHAWAEVEHDRNYKFSGVLPSALQWRLYLISGLLEVGDRELNQLSRDIDTYAASIKERAREGVLKDEELDSTTLPAALPQFVKGLKKTRVSFAAATDTLATVVEECRSFGIKTITDFKSLFTPDFLTALDESEGDTNEAGVTRDAMMYADIHRYLDIAWREHWEFTDSASVRLLGKKYGITEVTALLKKHGIEIVDMNLPDDFEYPDPQEE